MSRNNLKKFLIVVFLGILVIPAFVFADTIYEDNTASYQAGYYNNTGVAGNYWGMPFTATSTHTVTRIGAIMVNKSKTGDIIMNLYYADGSDHPTGSSLGTSNSVSAAGISNPTSRNYFYFPDEPVVTISQRYIYVFSCANCDTDAYGVSGYSGTDGKFSSNGSTWSNADPMLYEVRGNSVSGGGGSSGTTTPVATSSIEQTQQNINWSISFALVSFFGIIWLFKK